MSNFRPINCDTGFLLPQARAEERLRREQADHQSKLAARAEQEKWTGKKPRGRPPEPPTSGVKDKDQVNLTDEDSRIMKVAGGGFDQCYNARAVVATGSMRNAGSRSDPCDHHAWAPSSREGSPISSPLPQIRSSISASCSGSGL
jgi:hypothetical protein